MEVFFDDETARNSETGDVNAIEQVSEDTNTDTRNTDLETENEQENASDDVDFACHFAEETEALCDEEFTKNSETSTVSDVNANKQVSQDMCLDDVETEMEQDIASNDVEFAWLVDSDTDDNDLSDEDFQPPSMAFLAAEDLNELATNAIDDIPLQSKERNKKEKVKHACPSCAYTTTDKSNLTKHMRIHAGIKPFACTECAKTFSDSSCRAIHMKTHQEERPYKCGECGNTFKDQKALFNHHSLVHSTTREYTSFKCDQCDQTYSTKMSLKYHTVRKHEQVKGFACDECSEKFFTTGDLKIHVRKQHTGERPYKCRQCYKRFFISRDRKTHERTHTGERPYVCDICGKGFTQLANVKRHNKSHTHERPFKCDVCDMNFTTRSELKRHMETHNKLPLEPHLCSQCEYKATNRKALVRHIRLKHTDRKRHACELCNSTFDCMQPLKRHEQTAHADESRKYGCSRCTVQFFLEKKAKEHQDTHDESDIFQCTRCKRKFKGMTNIFAHFNDKHDEEAELMMTGIRERRTRSIIELTDQAEEDEVSQVDQVEHAQTILVCKDEYIDVKPMELARDEAQTACELSLNIDHTTRGQRGDDIEKFDTTHHFSSENQCNKKLDNSDKADVAKNDRTQGNSEVESICFGNQTYSFVFKNEPID